MFTGIIAGSGKIQRVSNTGGGVAFAVEADFDLANPEEGESIAVNGVCLTAYDIRKRCFSADVSPETLSRSTLGDFTAGQRLNLERALRLSDRLGGHIVSGHVDCIGQVHSIEQVGEYTVFHFEIPAGQARYIIEKGSVAIDGISLTVNSCSDTVFSVSIIPHTMKMTSLGLLKLGSRVNIEVDIIGKYVEKLLTPSASGVQGGARGGIGASFLAENGFF